MGCLKNVGVLLGRECSPLLPVYQVRDILRESFIETLILSRWAMYSLKLQTLVGPSYTATREVHFQCLERLRCQMESKERGELRLV